MKVLYTLITITALAVVFSQSAAAQTLPKLTIDKTEVCTGEKVTISLEGGSKIKYAIVNYGDGIYSYLSDDKRTCEHIYLKKGENEVSFQVWYAASPTPSELTKAEKKITVGETPELSFEDYPEEAKLVAESNADSYAWYLVDRKGNETLLQNTEDVLNYMESGQYKVVASSTDGCKSEAVKTVSFQKNMLADFSSIIVSNNVITPNNDGINDVLAVEDLDTYDEPCEVKVFSKTGKLVFERPKYSNTDGFKGLDDKGNELLAGTYYYVIKSKGRKGVTGFVDIIR